MSASPAVLKQFVLGERLESTVIAVFVADIPFALGSEDVTVGDSGFVRVLVDLKQSAQHVLTGHWIVIVVSSLP